jgi:inner membrane protein
LDNLTHTLVGLMLSRAGLNKLTPHATPILLLAANVPDIDIVTAFGGSLSYLDAHRGYTHALLVLPLMALLAVLPVFLLTFRKTKWRRCWRGALVAASVGVLSHLLLDWTNMYGIRMLLPFSSDWLRLDITNVVDFWIWAMLLFGVAAPLLSRLVSSEIGARSGTGRGTAIFVLVLLGGYEYGRFLLHQRAVLTLESRLYQDAAPLRVSAIPGAANPALWRGIVETNGFMVIGTVNLLQEFDPSEGTLYYQADAPRQIAAARATPVFQRYLRFSPNPLWRVIPAEKPENAFRVTAVDPRFGNPREGRFGAEAVVDPQGRVIESDFSFGPIGAVRKD